MCNYTHLCLRCRLPVKRLVVTTFSQPKQSAWYYLGEHRNQLFGTPRRPGTSSLLPLSPYPLWRLTWLYVYQPQRISARSSDPEAISHGLEIWLKSNLKDCLPANCRPRPIFPLCLRYIHVAFMRHPYRDSRHLLLPDIPYALSTFWMHNWDRVHKQS